MRGQLRVIMLSGREANGGGFPLVRQAILSARPQTNNGLAHRPVLRAVTSGSFQVSKKGLDAVVTGFCPAIRDREAFGVQSTTEQLA